MIVYTSALYPLKIPYDNRNKHACLSHIPLARSFIATASFSLLVAANNTA